MAKQLAVGSREYKVSLDARLFTDRKAAAEQLRGDLESMSRRLAGVRIEGQFEKTDKREIEFLDTPDETIRLNGFVFRRRHDIEKSRTRYTLKCRSADRYIAAASDVKAAEGADAEEKFEEDIAPPFLCRYSHSGTVTGPKEAPCTLKDASELFRALMQLRRDGAVCDGKTELMRVNALSIFERVLKGPTFEFSGEKAEVAIILWSDGADGRPLVAELSFRYEIREDEFDADVAHCAMRCFDELVRMDWCLPEGRTKTQFAYRER